MDADGKADPYLKVTLGNTEIDTRKEHAVDTLNPNFFRSFILDGELPGTSKLYLKCFDYDFIGRDDEVMARA